MLRYLSDGEATVWVETDAACEVEILERRARTFEVDGHHFALVVLTGLAPDELHEYEVRLDGARGWPEAGSEFPPSVIRPPQPDGRLRIAFGSCRVAAPQQPPYTLARADHPLGVGPDALWALAIRAQAQPAVERPDLLLLTGDQAYSCEGAPQTREFIRSRRDIRRPPGEEVWDFEEYASLYRESWSEPAIRWLLSTVPTAMLFCDHDVCEDWNTSHAWVQEMRRTDWWQTRVTSALIAFWLYQHLGNLAPSDLERDEVFAALEQPGDNGAMLRGWASRVSETVDARQFSYARKLGNTLLIALDTRTGRVLSGPERLIIDTITWEWVEQQTLRDCDHLLLLSSLPIILPHGTHALEAWDEAISAGTWGRALARVGERLRRRLSLEHWPAFQASFHRFADLLDAVCDGRHREPPATIIAISGDLHQGYLAEITFQHTAHAPTRVYQVVCSPLRNPLSNHEQRAVAMLNSRAGQRLSRLLARRAAVRQPDIDWQLLAGPSFENQIATLEFDGRLAHLTIERVEPNGERPSLNTIIAANLAGPKPG